MIEIKRYEAKEKELWDNFVKGSKNGVFFFLRDYMEYHSDRFEDHSLIFLKNNKPVALLPANRSGDTLFSHAGLTFGGIITNRKMKTSLMLQIFDSLKEYLKERGFKKLLYKSIPHIYHSYPSEEDLYALFINNATLIKREVSSTIKMDVKIPFSKNMKRNRKKAENKGLSLKRSYDFDTFMGLKEEQLLKKYGKNPTHTAEEMEYLADKFPDNIKLFAVEHNGEMVDGLLIYESENVVHAQYQGATERGMQLYASSFIYDEIINQYCQKKYFDFGISTENNGCYLNRGLIDFKERFGARSTVYDSYELKLVLMSFLMFLMIRIDLFIDLIDVGM
ncbi:GNAT family N-acetyltransferase [Methanobacterium sp. MBAC-LM]|uniref:GNAT family N-acetyltransferase n=1 Tax=Methanobacterium sp. MBAC-LM TaxID=3412034 RepID=UPI003C763338